jgi:hypothetical protein
MLSYLLCDSLVFVCQMSCERAYEFSFNLECFSLKHLWCSPGFWLLVRKWVHAICLHSLSIRESWTIRKEFPWQFCGRGLGPDTRMVRYSFQNPWKLYNCFFSYNVDGLLVHLLPSIEFNIWLLVFSHDYTPYTCYLYELWEEKINWQAPIYYYSFLSNAIFNSLLAWPKTQLPFSCWRL